MPSPYYRHSENIVGSAIAEFFFLDTTPIVSNRSTFWSKWFNSADPDRQNIWLEAALRSSTAPWKIVVGHHPILSGGPHKPSAALVERVKPLLERFGV